MQSTTVLDCTWRWIRCGHVNHVVYEADGAAVMTLCGRLLCGDVKRATVRAARGKCGECVRRVKPHVYEGEE